MLEMSEAISGPLNKMGFELIKLCLISSLAFVVVYFLIKTITTSQSLAKFLGIIALLVTFYFALMHIYLPNLQAT